MEFFRFCAFLIKGSSNTPPVAFEKKSMSKTFYKKVKGSPPPAIYRVFGRFSA
jgi:hypothetical protein